MDDYPVLTVTEGGEYEDIQPVHQYEEVLPHSQANTGQYKQLNNAFIIYISAFNFFISHLFNETNFKTVMVQQLG